MNLLITGGAGFIGSNFINYILDKYSGYNVVNYDLLTYAGNLDNLVSVSNRKNYKFVRGNITNRELINSLVINYQIDIIVNFAAETHVDRSINEPGVFVTSNVSGTQVLLDVAKENRIKKFIQISTDEVYGSIGQEGYFTENSVLAPNSPYSASKASGDLLVRAYHKTFELNTNITRCSNNYGPYQYLEKLIPLMITNSILGNELPIYGDGENIRDWLHVFDHCTAIDLILHNGKPGEIYNIGGNNERTNNEIVKLIINELRISENTITYIKDRPGHDRRYAIDSSKLVNELGWKQQYSFEKGIKETINWYIENHDWWEKVRNKRDWML